MAHQVGSDNKYVLPAYRDSIPEQFCSNRNPKPIPCSMQTVNVPSLTGSASAGGTSIIQIPCGSSAGILVNPYLRFSLQTTQTATGGNSRSFKGATSSCTALINRLSTYVNSQQVDNIQNADQVYDILYSHSSSNDWMTHDATILLGSGTPNVTGANATSDNQTFCVPLIGMLGSQQAFPLYLVNGTLQVQIDWNSMSRAFNYVSVAGTSMAISSVQLVYDRIQPEQAFIDSVRNSMMSSGSKFVYSYTNYQCTTMNSQAGQQTLNYGLNVSSLRGIISNQVLSADLVTGFNAQGKSLVNGLSQFIVSLDGRLINNNVLDGANAPAVVFAEANKAFGRIYDASISDTSTAANFADTTFMVGVSCQRTSENLAFSGSPVSIVGIQCTTAAANFTLFNVFISDYQLLLDVSGSAEIVR
jgi:hypothetical protein